MKLRYLLYSGLFLFGIANKGFAQANIQTLAPNPVVASEGAFLNPSYLKNIHKFQLSVAPFMGFNIRFANNFVSLGTAIDLTKLSDGGEMNFAPLHAVLDNLRKHNSVEFQADLTLINANFKVGKADNSFDVGVSVRHHAYVNQTTNGDFFRLLLEGNKQFAGQAVDFNPELSAISYTDIGVALSKTIELGELKVTPAARLRFLLGTGAIYTDHTKLEFYTQADGDYVELRGQLNGYAGGIIDFGELVNNEENNNSGGDLEVNDIFKSLGKGFALDLGVTVEYENISLSLASVDNGFIKFKEDHGWHIASQNSSIRWEGFEFETSGDGIELSDDFELFDSLDVTAKNKSFSTTIGSKITFNGNYGLIQKTDTRGNSYYMHNGGLSYIQGFKNRYNASTSPWIALYYQFNFKNKFVAGMNYNTHAGASDIGANIGVSGFGVNFGLGSNSLIAAFNNEASKQADIFFHLGFAF